MIRVSIVLIALGLGCCITSPLAAKDAPPLEPARLHHMLESGDDGMIVALFRRHPSAVLPFFDGLLEAGLAEIEASEAAGTPADRPEKALNLFRRAIRFASLADQAFGETVFATYANAFASWNAAERKRFREGQRLFREGRALAKTDPAGATVLFERSLRLAQPLGDQWGVAMASKALAEAQVAIGGEALAEAGPHAARAAQLYASLHLTRDELAALRLSASIEGKTGGAQRVEGSLARAWGIVRKPEWTDRVVTASIAEEYASILDRNGRPAQAEEVRRVARIIAAEAEVEAPTPQS